MRSGDICSLLKKLYQEGYLSKKELLILSGELKKTLKFASAIATQELRKKVFKENESNPVRNLLEVICERERLDTNLCLDELKEELIVKFLQPNFKKALEELNGKSCINYITTAVKNFLIDKWRKRGLTFTDLGDDKKADTNSKSFGEKFREGEILTGETPHDEIEKAELVELEEIFAKEVQPQELKYFCYHLVSKGKEHYRCLWGDKSKDAIYKDANRKKKIVVQFLEKLRDEYGFTYEIVKKFINLKLSEICEKKRLEICKKTSQKEG